jgi:transcriptional regulator with XRE-family HTH domain
MWTKKRTRNDLVNEYERGMLRSAFVSLFWNAMKAKGISRQQLANKIGVNKSAPSRWFSEDRPNWRIDTIADISNALGIELEITAIDRETGRCFAVSGPVNPVLRAVTRPHPQNFLFRKCGSGCIEPTSVREPSGGVPIMATAA